MDRFKAESLHVKGAPECLRISRFMPGITNPDPINRMNDNIPKSVDEMMSATIAFLNGEVVPGQEAELQESSKPGRIHDRFTPLIKSPKELLAMDTLKFKPPPPMFSFTDNRNKNKYCEFRGDKVHNTDEYRDRGHQIHHMYVDGGSASDVLYEHFFNRLLLEIKSRMIPATSLILGFIREISWPLGQISLLISLGDKEHSTSALMDFMVVRSPSPYNDIVERPKIKKIQVIPSTTHIMFTFLIAEGAVTLHSSRVRPIECRMVTKSLSEPILEITAEEKLLKENLDVFVWKPLYMTGIPRSVAEHRLNIKEGYPPEMHLWRGRRNVSVTCGKHQRHKGMSREGRSRGKAPVTKDTERGAKFKREVSKPK
ncbi:hypothetical protein Tco_1507151 [Tanacetum coccineum]